MGVCKLVENEIVEKKVVDEVCSKQSKVSAAECETLLSKVWEAIEKKECNSNEAGSPIKPMVCKLVESKAIEQKAVDALCSKQKKVPAAECEMALAKLWEALAKKE